MPRKGNAEIAGLRARVLLAAATAALLAIPCFDAFAAQPAVPATANANAGKAASAPAVPSAAPGAAASSPATSTPGSSTKTRPPGAANKTSTPAAGKSAGTPASGNKAVGTKAAKKPTASKSGGTAGGTGARSTTTQASATSATNPGSAAATSAKTSRSRAATAANAPGSAAATSAAPAAAPGSSAIRDIPKTRTRGNDPPAPDVITRIITQFVEVIPLWAKMLMFALGALIVLLAAGAHLRLRQRAGEYHHQALHDPLTELPNRTLFHARITEALAGAGRDGVGVAVLLIDLDGFKEVNDTLGHTSGDQLLAQVAARLEGAVRAGDTVARLGGDEFAVLLQGVTGEDTATSIADGLRRTLQGPYTLGDLIVHSDASVGIAIGPDHGEDADTLLRHADVAMYLAKELRAGAAVYDSGRDRYSPQRLGMIGELRRGIDRGEFVLFFQPQIEPASGRVDGVEALVRWQHPERGIIAPDEFIALAERTGVIRPLTLLVLESAIRACAGWRSAGQDLHVAVNLSAASLVDTELPTAIEQLLRRWAMPPSFLRLEITETTAMADTTRTRAVLRRLDSLGVALSIDDFGTGYSSLAYLRGLPVRELKIDRSFVSRMANDPNDHAIVVATIDLAHNLGLRVVAEGVEDEATLDELTRHGCDLVQGYLFAKPMPAGELQTWLAAWPGSAWADPRRQLHRLRSDPVRSSPQLAPQLAPQHP